MMVEVMSDNPAIWLQRAGVFNLQLIAELGMASERSL
jgi:hypothetical protein